jgi:isopentenyl diphosphate isomerase/L-lactate dehydrogenase-like FMN-dependent dehydrogenase
VGGQSGVERVLDIFRSELDVALGLLGCASVHDLDRSFVVGDSVSG